MWRHLQGGEISTCHGDKRLDLVKLRKKICLGKFGVRPSVNQETDQMLVITGEPQPYDTFRGVPIPTPAFSACKDHFPWEEGLRERQFVLNCWNSCLKSSRKGHRTEDSDSLYNVGQKASFQLASVSPNVNQVTSSQGSDGDVILFLLLRLGTIVSLYLPSSLQWLHLTLEATSYSCELSSCL